MDTLESKMRKLKEENPISAAIKDSHEVVGLIPGVVAFGGKQYDLRSIDKATAEKLVAAGFPNLKEKGKAATAPPESKK